MKIFFLNTILILTLIQNAWGEVSVPAGGPMESIEKYLDSPAGVLTVAGIATAYSTILYKDAANQEEESEKNIKKLDKIIASFKDSYTNLCPNGREKLTEPSCYCYLANGQKNSNRSNSTTCTDLWAKNSYKLSAESTDYSTGGYSADVAGCLNVNGQFDEACKCKKMLDSKGNNACKKSVSITIPTDTTASGIATGTGLNNLLKSVANATNGNPRYDLLNTGTLATNAVRTRQVADQLTSKLPKDTSLPKINDANVNKFAMAMLGKKNMESVLASSGGGRASAMNVGASRAGNPAVENLLKEAQQKAGLELSGSGKGLSDVKSDGKKPGMNFNFSEGGSGAGAQVLQDFPEGEKTYKYKNSDIVTDNSASIFEIISNRYIQSGLKRLFDDSSETK
ncbi:MAG: hypothetical protein K2Q18_04040 [Bdellovibrionales bacterium]|nr:hypothetical protein [Bdellovibrionales bacterium]